MDYIVTFPSGRIVAYHSAAEAEAVMLVNPGCKLFVCVCGHFDYTLERR